MYQDHIKALINQTLKVLNLPPTEYILEHPTNESFGDYSTNVAMLLFPKLKADRVGEYQNPHSLAKAIALNLSDQIKEDQIIKSVTVAGPGFINFSLTTNTLISACQNIMQNKLPQPLKGKKIAVEYTDPNPFKEFHIGHLYSNIIGESISRLYEANGALVWRGDFYGDVGMHIAKSVWGLLQKMTSERISLKDLKKLSLKKRQTVLGQSYAAGTIAFSQDNQAKATIKNINALIYAISQDNLISQKHLQPQVNYHQFIQADNQLFQQVKEVYQAGLQWSLDYFESYYQRLGTKFNGYYPESYVAELGMIEVEKGLQRGILEPGKDGTIIYKGEKNGLHTRVFRNALGLPTYEAKDLGLVVAKYNDFKFDYSLNIFGKEIDEYYKVVKKVIEQINPVLGHKQTHLAHGMVNVPSGKMSSRYGNIITVEWLLNTAKDKSLMLMKDSHLSQSDKNSIAEQIGQAAIKYALLSSNIGDNVTFDFNQSVKFSGKSGPYLQYTHARCQSVLTKSGLDSNQVTSQPNNQVTLNPQESSLLHWFYRYPEVVAQAAAEYAPHHLCTYLYELAQRYNAFYNSHTILGSSKQPVDQPTRNLRLSLTAATAQILKNGLSLLGIQAPNQM